MFPFFEVNGSLLIAVPAIHYRAVFAREVNYLCSCKETRPDAVAVELGPHITYQILVWMKELVVSTSGKSILPCMLGILIKNRLIHPDYSDTALYLQEYFGKPLRNIPPLVLKQLLHFSDKYLVGLSSTDSIIEAVRCAVELDIPVYGVDMDEFSVKPEKRLLVKEPGISDFNLREYISENEITAAATRDPYVYGRREHVMVSRLKSILNRHKKVLFTGGLAHWSMIKGLLKNPDIRPADFLVPEIPLNFTRIILHPSIAVAFMDTYPIMTTIYEENRHNPSIKREYLSPLPEKSQLCKKILRRTYSKYFKSHGYDTSEEKVKNESHRIPDFERLLANLRMVHQRSSPSVTELLNCGDAMIPSGFNGILLNELMDIGRSWASPKQFPELPIISLFNDEEAEQNNTEHIDLFNLTENHHNKKPGVFTVQFHNVNNPPERYFNLWKWDEEPEKHEREITPFSWVWPPCEALMIAIANEAAKMAVTRSNESVSSAFEGSLYNGLDIKGTIRSVIRGENKIYIKRPYSEKQTFSPDGKKPEPTVFIFSDNQDDINSEWMLFIGGKKIDSYVKDKVRYREIERKSGSYFISSIARMYYQEVPFHLRNYVYSIGILEGYTTFGNSCINSSQTAQWLEDNDYKCCPVMNNASIYSLAKYYKKLFNIELAFSDWKTTLIQIAIPFAKERFIVLAPRRFKIPERIYSEAKKRNVIIDLLPMEYFPDSYIAEMRKKIMLTAIYSDEFCHSSEIEKALGQKVDTHFELLPLYMQQQLKNPIKP